MYLSYADGDTHVMSPAASMLHGMYADENDDPGILADLDNFTPSRPHSCLSAVADTAEPQINERGQSTICGYGTCDSNSPQASCMGPSGMKEPINAVHDRAVTAENRENARRCTTTRPPLRELPVMENQLDPTSQSRRSPSYLDRVRRDYPAPQYNRRTPIRGVQRHNDMTVAYLESRSQREYEVDTRRLQLEERSLELQIKQHSDKMRLKEMEMQERQVERESQAEQRRQELKFRQIEQEALAEERRLMAAERQAYMQHQRVQLEMLNNLFSQIKK
ncbi:uncharacterized protein [Dermacentor andersoni]|uniref:uncharacterized protein n=1 Tax=Dermacentor andersoni TaxID=34620 RepID=UPI003B3A342B